MYPYNLKRSAHATFYIQTICISHLESLRTETPYLNNYNRKKQPEERLAITKGNTLKQHGHYILSQDDRIRPNPSQLTEASAARDQS